MNDFDAVKFMRERRRKLSKEYLKFSKKDFLNLHKKYPGIKWENLKEQHGQNHKVKSA